MNILHLVFPLATLAKHASMVSCTDRFASHTNPSETRNTQKKSAFSFIIDFFFTVGPPRWSKKKDDTQVIAKPAGMLNSSFVALML